MQSNKLIATQTYYPDQQMKLAWSFFNPDASQIKINEAELVAIAAKVREKERKLIGQELHDNINQILFSAKLFAEMLNPADAGEAEIQQKTVTYVARAIEEIRKLAGEMVKPTHEEKGLVDSIRQIIDDIHFSTPIKIEFKHSKNIECLAHDKQITLLRIVQEQIKNVIKYSKASLVNIKIYFRNGKASLLIKDNGIGFDPKQAHNGIGLSNIYERAQSMNGVVNLQSSKGLGCTLSVAFS